VLTRLTFPKEEDFRKKNPKEALESVIRMARMVAKCKAKPVRVLFIDQTMPIKIGGPNCHFPLDDYKQDEKKSILGFMKEVTVNALLNWPAAPCTGNTKTPIFVVTNEEGSIQIYKNEVCYAIVRNPGNDQLTIDAHSAFKRGKVEADGKWKKETDSRSSPFFEVHPSGMCDSVSFMGERCPEYNHNFVVDSVSGIVKKI
jgi:hypothetical protein